MSSDVSSETGMRCDDVDVCAGAVVLEPLSLSVGEQRDETVSTSAVSVKHPMDLFTPFPVNCAPPPKRNHDRGRRACEGDVLHEGSGRHQLLLFHLLEGAIKVLIIASFCFTANTILLLGRNIASTRASHWIQTAPGAMPTLG